MYRIRDFIAKRRLLASLLLIALIVAHGLYSDEFKVDNTSLLLVLLLILLPYIPLLNRIKFGDFEAEIGQKDLRRVEEKVRDIPSTKEQSKAIKKTSSLEDLA